jgi:twitching motility protein PilJ
MKPQKSQLVPRLATLCIASLLAGMAIGIGALVLAGADVHALTKAPALTVVATGLVVMLGICIGALRRWLNPLSRVQETLTHVIDGDLDARTGLAAVDEIGRIGADIDRLLSQRNELPSMEEQHSRLFQSVNSILEPVSKMAQRDMSVRVASIDTVVAPIAEALNRMAIETSRTLRDVTEIATNVAESSNLIKSQSDQIVLLARAERENLEECANDLDIAAEAHNHIARIAAACAEAGDKAVMATRIARISAANSVSSFRTIREALSDTERRVRLLIERSQEITGAVNLITHLCERTHILALNASMHAAAVGDAGRSFSAVADEVQRLAENAREMANQLKDVVQHIQADSGETMTSLQALVSHVHSASEQADRSHHDIDVAEQSSASLVESVQKIAAAAATQQQISSSVRQRTTTMLDHVSRTGAFLLGQSEHTDNLAEQAVMLVQTISTFRLSDDPAASSE